MNSTTKLSLKLFLIFLFISQSLFSQNKIDPIKKEKFDSAWSAYTLDMTNIDQLGKIMVDNAQSDYQSSIGYNILAEHEIKELNYVKSIYFLEKAKSAIKKTDSIQQYLRVLGSSIITYRQSGLIVESDQNWQLFNELLKKIPARDREMNQLFVRARMYDIDKNYCKSASTREKFYNLTKTKWGTGQDGFTFNFAIMVQIVYDQFKCGRVDDAKKSMIEVENLLSNIKSEHSTITMYEFYLLNKALFQINEKQIVKAKESLNEAYKLSLRNASINLQKVILEERLGANIDNDKEKLHLYKLLTDIKEKEITSTKKITINETTKKNVELNTIMNEGNYYFFILCGLCVITIGFVFYYYHRNRQLKHNFHQIIQKLDQTIERGEVSDEFSEKIIKNDETERDLLRRLNAFEQKKLYNTKGLSAAQMAVMLKTNTKYLSYILKEYRESDFYHYINNQRINFIVKELYENPSLLNYKISVLSDMCGYASHSQFTSIFKGIKKISPSQYISFLNEENKEK